MNNRAYSAATLSDGTKIKVPYLSEAKWKLLREMPIPPIDPRYIIK